ncbi:hypothetical protein PCL_00032 [Purpureocillium lilacinum]|uniref:Uncharacterized protein n=1 Tax=Purpureocillium lilacinum TaxID=33203 RepID=A0A2U3DP83_PURLI|nr:hypothetical protein PCL_00032 [Purpureocillium lilacinum]
MKTKSGKIAYSSKREAFWAAFERAPEARHLPSKQGSTIDLTGTLLTHAKLYVFADRYEILKLMELSLFYLHDALIHIQSTDSLDGTVQLIEYGFAKDNPDALKDLVLQAMRALRSVLNSLSWTVASDAAGTGQHLITQFQPLVALELEEAHGLPLLHMGHNRVPNQLRSLRMQRAIRAWYPDGIVRSITVVTALPALAHALPMLRFWTVRQTADSGVGDAMVNSQKGRGWRKPRDPKQTNGWIRSYTPGGAEERPTLKRRSWMMQAEARGHSFATLVAIDRVSAAWAVITRCRCFRRAATASTATHTTLVRNDPGMASRVPQRLYDNIAMVGFIHDV